MDSSPHELKEYWLGRALAAAGIDRRHWHPSAGVEQNRRTIESVYDYYGRLFLDHPFLKWAGMASMIGPAFYAGFKDLGLVPDAIRRAVIATLGRASRSVADWATGDLGFYETTFLTMQKKIFEDQATMHEAYLGGGLDEIEKLYSARIIDVATLVAWQQIDRGRDGDGDSVNSGNRTLLLREQRDIIDRFYVLMLAHRRPEGPVLTYLFTVAGAPSVPGAHSYPDIYPLTLQARLSRAVVRLRTPLADGNIAVFADRWGLIETDTLPDYLAFVKDQPDTVRTLLATPIAERVAGYRLLARSGRLARAGLTHWDLHVSPAAGVEPAAPRPPTVGARVEIDLQTAPTRESLEFAPDRDSRIWMNGDRTPFAVTVTLPRGRNYSTQTEIALAESSAFGGAPDRVTVQLPPAGIAETTQLLSDYARTWGFPESAVAQWREDAEARAGSDRAYSTHVFTPDDVGHVHLEFQVSHHVRDGYFVTAALFSWNPINGRPGNGPPS